MTNQIIIQDIQNKIALVKNFPVPRSQRDLRSFLGLANYYRKFVQGFSSIATPLNRLLAKNVLFQWSEECQISFDKLKEALTTAPVLLFPDFSKLFILYTDASSHAIGYVLGQVDDSGRMLISSRTTLFQIFQVITPPVPINHTTPHAARLVNIPDFLAILSGQPPFLADGY